jgi:signal transduction histidine kinase
MVLSILQNTVRVLLVDDDDEDFFIIKRLFLSMKGLQCELEWISNSEEAIESIKSGKHDVYLIDYRLDARTGLDVLHEVNAADRYEPFILLTGVGDQGVERASLKLAASDYIVKRDLTSDSLARAIYYALGRKEQERQKIDQLIQLNQTKDEFISIASHQLRTPATTVKQYVAMVMDGLGGEINEKQQKLLMKAYDSNERQLTIINDLLKVAQIDAGRMNMTLKEINISELIAQVVTDFEPLFAAANQIINSTIAPNIHITTDESALRMVIDNLLENAKKYSEANAATRITLKIKNETIRIEVSDEGVGVEDPSRLFKKFSRINNKLSTEVGGTGLGLYWAQSIADMLNGELSYEKKAAGGSRFVFTLPYV